MAMATHDVTDTNVMGDINVTPMVDVMLVLLIIFMVVTPAIAAGFTARLPTGAHLKQRDSKDDRTVLGISSDGAYYLNKKLVPGCSAVQRQNPAGKTSCDTQLLVMLQQDYQKHPNDRVLFLRADQAVMYGQVMDAMSLAKKSGAVMVAAVSEQTPGTSTKLEQATD